MVSGVRFIGRIFLIRVLNFILRFLFVSFVFFNVRGVFDFFVIGLLLFLEVRRYVW